MMLWSIVMLFMNRDRCMNYMRLDGLLVYYWLNCFVYVVMYMLTSYFWYSLRMCVLSIYTGRFVLKLSLFVL